MPLSEHGVLRQLLVVQKVAPGLALRLAQYGQSVLEANQRFNLTGAQTPVEMLAHITDALSIVPYVGDPHVDVGSGAGFPAVPVALATGVEIVLIEASTKKAAFLSKILADFNLRGQVLAERAERAAHDPSLRERFASATARAVSSAPAVAELTVPFLRLGGQAILQRGRAPRAEADALADAALLLGARLLQIAQLSTGSVFLLQKDRPTPSRFPRKPGLPHKRPLCWQNSPSPD
ncbi:MAG: 16S rRNA (guanine(527)-N(7))-methyltransferase RsmG [Candidatus Eremiobacteraeota bacterium]|nr:16S rRNA (guanine(527)-N(7))-methyltransferase RsmG [Candidatus Eremiobacteraeota bacterium]